MGHYIRILQIGDLLIDSEKSARSIADALKDFKKTLDLDLVDYVVICGNLTANGRPEQFKAALSVLNVLRDTYFYQKNDYSHNRTFFVPGAADVPRLPDGGRDYSGFDWIYQEFFGDLLAKGQIEPFRADCALVRSLVDLSLIGIPFFADFTDADAAIEAALKLLEETKPCFEEWKYAVETPTILVSSYSALLTRDGAARIRQLANNPGLGMPLDLHLMGAPVTCILPEPYHCDHVTVGLGPRVPGGAWSNRINLIKIRQRDWGTQPEPKEMRRRSVHVSAHRRNLQIKGGWDKPVTLFEGNLAPSHNKGDGFVYQDILASLEEKLEEGHVAIRVTGLPGQGKKQIYFQLKSEDGSQLFRNSIPLVCDVLVRYGDWEKLIQDLLQRGEAHSRKIVVINDQASRLGGRTRFQQLENIEQKLGDIANRDCRFIYLYDYVSSPPALPNGFEAYPLPPLGAKALYRLVERYSSRLPIKHSHITALTGGYLGFLLSLLQDVKRIIEEELPGAKPIDADTSWSLIVEALRESKDLAELTRRFFEVIADEPGGRDLCDFLRLELEDRIAASGQTEDLLKPLRFTVEDALQRLSHRGLRIEKADFSRAVETLVQAKLLELEDGKYRLVELIPFLVRSLTASTALRGGKQVSSVRRSTSEKTIFVSYAHKSSDRVQAIVSRLRDAGFAVWWDQDLLPGEKWNAELNNQLRRASCILVAWSRAAVETSDYVFAEAETSRNKVVSVLLEKDLDIPVPFNAIQHADLTAWESEVPEDEWNRLISGIKKKFLEPSAGLSISG